MSPFFSAFPLIVAFVAVALAFGAGFALVSAWQRRGFSFVRHAGAGARKAMPLFGPNLMILQRLHISGASGGVLTLGTLTLALIGIPEIRLFVLMAALSGCAFGVVLRLRDR